MIFFNFTEPINKSLVNYGIIAIFSRFNSLRRVNAFLVLIIEFVKIENFDTDIESTLVIHPLLVSSFFFVVVN